MASPTRPSVNPKAAYGVAAALFALAVVNVVVGLLYSWIFLFLAVVWLAIALVWLRLVTRALRRDATPPDGAGPV